MVIRVQCKDRRWQVIHPLRAAPIGFASGAVAFDFADALARAHHDQTGQFSAVRVEALGAFVDAVRYGAAAATDLRVAVEVATEPLQEACQQHGFIDTEAGQHAGVAVVEDLARLR